MLERIESFRNVGVFRDALPGTPLDLGPVTLIYGQNGQGKSTLSMALRALSSHGVKDLTDRKNWYTGNDPLIKIVSGAGTHVFANNRWTGTKPEIRVFDMQFVEENIHSGWSVRPDHRQRLYSFVVGREAASLEESYAKADEAEKKAGEAKRKLEEALKPFMGTFSLAQFKKLPPDPDIDQKIAAAEAKKQQAANAGKIMARPTPAKIEWEAPPMDGIWKAAAKSYAGVALAVEERVKAHCLELHPKAGQAWVKEGMGFVRGKDCPFCGQDLSLSELFGLYGQYFDDAYRQMLAEAESLSALVDRLLPEDAFSKVSASLSTNTGRRGVWAESLPMDIPEVDLKALEASFRAARDTLRGIASKKAQAPLDSVDTAEARSLVEEAFAQIKGSLTAYDAAVTRGLLSIGSFKVELAKSTPSQVENEIAIHRTVKKRHEPVVAAKLADLEAAEGEHKLKRAAKTAALESLNAHVKDSFKKYHKEMNRVLKRFGASFIVKSWEDDHKGGIKRAEFVLDFEGIEVGFVGAEKTVPGRSFGEALSEGDKRTLALAFFLAKAKKDSGSLADTILVLDDPICSLGAYRRHATKTILLELKSECRQLIVLCHDPFFIRDLAANFREKHHGKIEAVQLHLDLAPSGGTRLNVFKVEDLCATSYYKEYALVREYVESRGVGDHTAVLKALRPLCEGYMRRRWVGAFESLSGLGEMLGEVRRNLDKPRFSSLDGSDPNNKRLLDELESMNEFVREVHHGSAENAAAQIPVPATILVHAKAVMEFIYH